MHHEEGLGQALEEAAQLTSHARKRFNERSRAEEEALLLTHSLRLFVPHDASKNRTGSKYVQAHYSKSQIFVHKSNFDKTIQFSREIKVVNS